ncbi:MAG: YkvA family protein [Desulfobacterales bacterium]
MESDGVFDRMMQRAQRMRQDALALFLAYRDPRVPSYSRVFILCVVAYAFSPLDLIPDFIPVLGYLDDVLILPLGIYLAVKMVPADVFAEYRLVAREIYTDKKPISKVAAIVVLVIWLLLASLLGYWLLNVFGVIG